MSDINKLKVFFLLIGLLFIRPVFALPLNQLKLPQGFHIELFAHPVPDARSLTLGDQNTIFVGTRTEGKVYAIITNNKNHDRTQVFTIASRLDMPNGVAFHNGALYVAETSRILRFDNIENRLQNPPKPVVISKALPKNQQGHEWRYIAFGPDEKLYVTIGVPCNVCLPKDKRLGTIMRMNPDGSNVEIVVKGIRNSVGLDWDPKTQKLWFTHNQRDWLGDDIPPDNLNYVPQAGVDFGFPYYIGKNLLDPVYGKQKPPDADFLPPTFDLPAHTAPLGMAFYTGSQFPAEYQSQVFVAQHGSWNRSKKIGYQVIHVKINGDQVVSAKPFITGWLQGQRAWGRPVDIINFQEGLLISDDHAGVIYKVTYQNK